MGIIDYKKLYILQDKVLDIVFATQNEFYLTGGTCLSRFYKDKRYSEDLDFFTNNSPRYSFAVKNIKLQLQKHFKLDVEVESKDIFDIYLISKFYPNRKAKKFSHKIDTQYKAYRY